VLEEPDRLRGPTFCTIGALRSYIAFVPQDLLGPLTRVNKRVRKKYDSARQVPAHLLHYRSTSLIRKRTSIGPYRRPMLRLLGES